MPPKHSPDAVRIPHLPAEADGATDVLHRLCQLLVRAEDKELVEDSPGGVFARCEVFPVTYVVEHGGEGHDFQV